MAKSVAVECGTRIRVACEAFGINEWSSHSECELDAQNPWVAQEGDDGGVTIQRSQGAAQQSWSWQAALPARRPRLVQRPKKRATTSSATSWAKVTSSAFRRP